MLSSSVKISTSWRIRQLKYPGKRLSISIDPALNRIPLLNHCSCVCGVKWTEGSEPSRPFPQISKCIIFTNPRMHMFHIPQCSIQNINVYISILNGALWELDQLGCRLSINGWATVLVSCQIVKSLQFEDRTPIEGIYGWCPKWIAKTWLAHQYNSTNVTHSDMTYFLNMHIMMTSSNGNIFRFTGHLWGEFTGPRWIPHTKASDAKLWCFLWSASE